MAWNVLILGGGFGGLTAARRLERKLPPHSAKVTLVNDVNFMLYTPLLPGAAGGTLEPRHVVVPLREQLRRTELHLGHVTGADPGRRVVAVRSILGRRRGAALRPADRRAGLHVAHAARSPGWPSTPWGSRRWPRRSRCATGSSSGSSRPRSRRTRRRGARCSRSCSSAAGYAGLEGLAELQDFAADLVERYPRARLAGHALHPRRGARPGDAGDPARPRRVRDDRAAPARHRGHARDADRARDRGLGDAVDGRARADQHRRVDRGRQAAPGRRGARACRSTTAAGSSATASAPCPGGPACGRSATRRRCPIPRSKGNPSPPTAQHVLRQAKVAADNVAERARRRAAQAAPVPLPHARGVRRHGPQPGGREHARDQVARLPGVVPRPHVPPGADAGLPAARRGSWRTGRSGCCSGATPPSSASSGTRPPLEQQEQAGGS